MNRVSSSSAPTTTQEIEHFDIHYESWINKFNNQSTVTNENQLIQQQSEDKKSLSEILPSIQKRLEKQHTCVFSADDNLSEQIDMQFEEEELWSLPQFLEDTDMLEEEDAPVTQVIQRSNSINSNSTCHSDFGNNNSGNMIDQYAGNANYAYDVNPSLKLRRCNAICPVKRSQDLPVMSVEQAQALTSEALHRAFFGQQNSVQIIAL